MSNAVEHLIQEYQARSARNAAYSLRSFAKSIGVSHTLLSLVINRKRAVSPAMLTKLKQHIPTIKDREIEDLKPKRPTAQMQIKEFAPIATWIHYAILSLTQLQDFELDDTAVARRLGVSKTQARLAIDDLKNCKVIGLDKVSGKWRQRAAPLLVNNTKATQVTSEFIRSYLKKAEATLDYGNFEERDMRVITFAMNKNDLSYARQKLANFRRELSDELESRGDANMVVALNTNLFPLTIDQLN